VDNKETVHRCILDKVAEKAGIFLGSETGLQYYIFMPFDICFRTLGRLN
jgi:hypothetical protein